MLTLNTVADPGFSRGGAWTLQGGAWTLQGGREHAKFSRKLHEIERIWTPRGGRASLTPPPRSANEILKLYLIFTVQYPTLILIFIEFVPNESRHLKMFITSMFLCIFQWKLIQPEQLLVFIDYYYHTFYRKLWENHKLIFSSESFLHFSRKKHNWSWSHSQSWLKQI